MNSNPSEQYNNSYFANNNYDNHGHHDYYLNQMQHHQHYSRHPPPSAATAQQNLHNYFNCNNPSRSLSVPEGLSIISEQCTCSTNVYNTTAPTTAPTTSSNQQRLTRQRSQSLSKPMHVIEQITTSV